MKKSVQITRQALLQNIFNNFQRMTQWITLDLAHYHKYHSKAECLIEILETIDCGLKGGYDKQNPVKWGESGFDLYDRFLALIRKEKTKLNREYHFTPNTMRRYWLLVSEAREHFNK